MAHSTVCTRSLSGSPNGRCRRAHVRAKYSALGALCLAFEQHLPRSEATVHSPEREMLILLPFHRESLCHSSPLPSSTRSKKHKQRERPGAHGHMSCSWTARTGADVLLQLAPHLVTDLARALLADRSLGSQVAHLLDTLTRSTLGCIGQRPRSQLRPLTAGRVRRFSKRYLTPLVGTLERAESARTDEPLYARQLVQQLAFDSLDPDVDELFDASAALSLSLGSGTDCRRGREAAR